MECKKPKAVCHAKVMSDKSFKIELKTPLTAALLHKVLGNCLVNVGLQSSYCSFFSSSGRP